MSRAAYAVFAALLLLACAPDSPIEPRSDTPRTARITGPNQGVEGTSITFDGTASSDPDHDSLTYAWTFGDGSTGKGRAPPHSYRNNGSYQVSLIVQDTHGAADTARETVMVVNLPPVVSIQTTLDSLALGVAARLRVTFSDPGVDDSLTARLQW